MGLFGPSTEEIEGRLFTLLGSLGSDPNLLDDMQRAFARTKGKQIFDAVCSLDRKGRERLFVILQASHYRYQITKWESLSNEDLWIEIMTQINNLIVDFSGQDLEKERFLRRKLENWAINKSSGKLEARKARLKRKAIREQGGKCAECGDRLDPAYFELDRIDAQYADQPDQGYRKENVRAVHPKCNPRGPYSGGRGSPESS